MKRTYLPFLFLLAFTLQAQNPFSKYKYNVETATLTNGEFDENHDKSKVVEMDDLVFDTRTGKITGKISKATEGNGSAGTSRFISMDPHAERYYHISPYAYCMNNPLRYVDPDGRDVWELNQNGQIINRIEDKSQDAFYIVSQNNDGNYERMLDSDGGEIGISFKYGTVTSVKETKIKITGGQDAKMTMFNIKGDENATQLFEFMANPGITTNVEWSLDRIGAENSGKNIVGNMHHESKTAQGYYLMKNGYTIKEDIHSHPKGTAPNYVDWGVAGEILNKNKNATFKVYTGNGKYIPYDDIGIIYPGRPGEIIITP